MALKRKDAPGKGTARRATRGTGAGEYKVKGRRATARQRAVIDGILEQAVEDRASRRVMVAAIMCATQESVMGEEVGRTGNDDLGIYHQGRNWIDEAGARDPRRATHAFLVTGPTSWVKVHGGVKKAPGDLNAALMRVQGSVGGYGQWEPEAGRTVDFWLDEGDVDPEGGSYTKRYTFTRGARRGERENSWDASLRLVQEVGAYRWAAGNVFYAVSGDELRRGKPSLMIRGDEGWLRKEPAWSWASRRSISEMSIEVLADRWDVMPGGVVQMHRDLGPMSGKWIVYAVSGSSLDAPDATVVLRRPTRFKSEPASERVDRGGEAGGEVGDTYPGSPVPGQRFHTATHETAGLAGYPAFDYMAPAGTPVVAPADGRIDKLGGSAPGAHCRPGGACGFSIYMSGGGKSYFLTHVDKVSVKVGDHVRQGDQIAEVADGPRSWSTPHVHMGVRG